MHDLIERQAAIDAHYEYCNKHPDAGFPVWSLKILEDLPSAQPETHEERTETHACDLISRQAVIEINRSYHGQMPNEVNHRIWKEINELPSAQPDSKELSFTQKKLDTISRQAAIRWVKTECNPYGKPTLDFESGKKVIEHLKQMPSAQPERKKGKWIKHIDDLFPAESTIECSMCHHEQPLTIDDSFCPHCGARMEGES